MCHAKVVMIAGSKDKVCADDNTVCQRGKLQQGFLPNRAGPVCKIARRVLTVAGMPSSPVLPSHLSQLCVFADKVSFCVLRTGRAIIGAGDAQLATVFVKRLLLKRVPTSIGMQQLAVYRMGHASACNCAMCHATDTRYSLELIDNIVQL